MKQLPNEEKIGVMVALVHFLIVGVLLGVSFLAGDMYETLWLICWYIDLPMFGLATLFLWDPKSTTAGGVVIALTIILSSLFYGLFAMGIVQFIKARKPGSDFNLPTLHKDKNMTEH